MVFLNISEIASWKFILSIMWLATTENAVRVVISTGGHGWYLLQTLQCVRVLRLAHLSGFHPGVRKLYYILVMSMPSVVNLVLCNICVFFIFAVIRQSMCGGILHDSNGEIWQSQYFSPKIGWQSAALTADDNFDGIGSSMMVLLQLSAGQAFRPMITDCQAHTDNSPVLVTLFFVMFFVISNFIFISLFEALLLDNFDLLGSDEFSISDLDITIFREQWVSTGLRLDQAMDASFIAVFVAELHCVFGLIHRADPYWYNRVLLELGLTADDVLVPGRSSVTIHQMLKALCLIRFSTKCFKLEEEAEEVNSKHKLHHMNHAARVLQC